MHGLAMQWGNKRDKESGLGQTLKGESAMRYTVFEYHSGGVEQVLKTDCLDEAKARYSKCYASQRGQGGVWCNVEKRWVV